MVYDFYGLENTSQTASRNIDNKKHFFENRTKKGKKWVFKKERPEKKRPSAS